MSAVQTARISTDAITQASAHLRDGGLVAFPTETVYGLGADATNPTAVAKIFAVKGRPTHHPLIVHLPDANHLQHWALTLPECVPRLVRAFWPGPLTLVLKCAAHVDKQLTGGQDSIGLRVPAHPLALALLRDFGRGIAAPSANRFGRISPTTAAHVRAELADAAVILDGGACAVGIESTILDLSGDYPLLLRPGMLAAHTLAEIIGSMPQMPTAQTTTRAPGRLAAHYAPITPLIILPQATLFAAIRTALAANERIAVLATSACPQELAPMLNASPARMHWQMMATEPQDYAHDLYAHLRYADTLGYKQIMVEAPPSHPDWQAIDDRIQRAANTTQL